MNGARKLLIISGLTLALWGMGWGLLYAVFIEHQSLETMGGLITAGFVTASQRNMPTAHMMLAGYAHAEFSYVRQVDVHSHWIGLAMILILLGVVFDRVQLPAKVRFALAAMLAVGSAVFPLGVALQTVMSGRLPSALAVAGAALVTAGMTGAAIGFGRAPAEARVI